jgi:uncharacterized protein YjiS (DUF1127 family)
MSYVTTTHNQRTGFARVQRLFSPAGWLGQIQARRDLMRLRDLPDYLLKDIGLERDDIAGLVAQAHRSPLRRT